MKISEVVFGIILPAYVTDWVCCYKDDEGELYTEMAMDVWDEDVDPVPDSVIKVKCIAWLGRAWLGKQDSEPLTYQEWRDGQ